VREADSCGEWVGALGREWIPHPPGIGFCSECSCVEVELKRAEAEQTAVYFCGRGVDAWHSLGHAKREALRVLPADWCMDWSSLRGA